MPAAHTGFESLVVTLIGADRPGIVARLAEVAVTHGAGWEESKMARLAGHFAGIVRLEAPAESIAALEQSLTGLASEGLKLTIDHGASTPRPERVAALELLGHDRQGIVRDISTVLARYGVGIDELETEIESASMSGEQMFRARAELRLPADVRLEALCVDLEALADELMVELSVDAGARAGASRPGPNPGRGPA